MNEPRMVFGDEAKAAISAVMGVPTIVLGDGTRFYHCGPNGAHDALIKGYYEVSANHGIVMHWTRKRDVLVEIGALLSGGE